jgi:hypothetical protein
MSPTIEADNATTSTVSGRRIDAGDPRSIAGIVSVQKKGENIFKSVV